ncbi:hypothetical protein, partial [Xanthomonas sp. WCS2017Cala2-12]
DVFISDVYIDKYSNTFNRNLSVNVADRWRNPGDIVSQPAATAAPIIPNLSKYVYDGTYMRISNINLSYKV